MKHSSEPWWTTDFYVGEHPTFDLPLDEFPNYVGPQGIALVRAWPDGRTDQGWGLNPPPGSTEGFMPRYLKGDFNARKVLYGYNRSKWAFAFIMRSTQLVCIDIDGKNGGLDGAKKLVLPPTLAETSKSGNGYHLFYLHEEEWDPVKGFGDLGDRIGFEQGVDFRATGCVYHHDTQRWNDRMPAPLPDHLVQILKNREQKLAARSAGITSTLESQDDMEILMMQDDILVRLSKPIPAGKRNNTLFAIGSEMAEANIPNWEMTLAERALDLGLPNEEVDKLVKNITSYGLSGVRP